MTSQPRFKKCPKHIDTYFVSYGRCPKCVEEAMDFIAKAEVMRAFVYLLDKDKHSLNNVSADFPSKATGMFLVAIKSDEEDDGTFYDGEGLIRLAKSEGWSVGVN